jgi:hypothetical protein
MPRIRPNGGAVGYFNLPTAAAAGGVWSVIEENLYRGNNAFPTDATGTTGTDPQFNLTSLLLHGDGSSGANNSVFQDSSTNAFTITRTGTPTQGSFSPFSQTGWSMYTGTGGAGYGGGTGWIQTASSSAINIGTGAFTVEFWVYKLSNVSGNYANYFALNNYTNGIFLRDEISAGTDAFYIGGTPYNIQPQTYIPLNQWVHVVVSRNASGNFALFANGSRFFSGTNAYNLGTSAAIAFADVPTGSSGASNPPSCYMSNMRITNTAVYDPTLTTLTVPTSPLTAISGTLFLAGKDNRFIDSSSNAQSITISGTPTIVPFSPFAPAAAYGVSAVGGSAYFNGSTDWITAPMNTAITGDFTAECWIYCTASAAAYNGIFAKRTNGSSYSPFLLGLSAGGSGTSIALLLSTSGSSWNINTTFGAVTFNQWNHIALVRNGSAIKCYLNGTSVYSGTLSGTLYNPADAFSVGALAANGYGPFNGYISNVRLVIGTAVYTSVFTPPTSPVTAITNTQLLVNGTNAGIYDSTTKNNLLTGSTAGLSTTQSKFGGSSMYFDGTINSAIYAVPSTASLNPISNSGAFRAGDFTIECWVYPTASGGYQCFATNRNSAGGAGTWLLGLYTGTTQVAWFNGGTVTLLSSALTVNNWYHVAVCRSGGTIKMFLNGALTGTNTAADTTDYSVGVLSIGYDIVETAYGFAGYIDEFRISRYARYTNTFTPSPSAFLNK